MVVLKLPPKIKVLEALSAVCGGRVRRLSNRLARVVSSDGSREYTVYLDIVRGEVYSDDNGTRYRNYVGYPIIAFMMELGILPKNEAIGKPIVNVPWRKLNEQYKSYELVMKHVLSILQEHDIRPGEVYAYINQVVTKLSKYRLKKLENMPTTLRETLQG